MARGVIRSRPARTGAPASASTALTPTVRNSVLLPDMFDPLMTSAWRSPPRETLLRTQADPAIKGCPTRSASNQAPAPAGATSGTMSPGHSQA